MPRTPKTTWGLGRRIESTYAKNLIRLTNRISERLDSANTPDEIKRLLRGFASDPEYIRYCESLAEMMAKAIHRNVNTHWRRAALEGAHKRSRVIFEELEMDLLYSPLGRTINEIIYENAKLISTIPDKLGDEMAVIISRDFSYRGVRSSQLAKEIKDKFKELSVTEAKRIARTETSKAQTALTRARAQNIGLNWYIWRTAQDGDRVRASHRHMEGVLVNWDNPPSPEVLINQKNPPPPYNAGNIYNCRCYPEPVIDINWIDFPREVYHNGIIRRMTKAEFEKIAA